MKEKRKKKKAADDKKKRIADEKAKKEKVALEKKRKEEKARAAEAERKRKEKIEADRKKKLEEERKRKEAEAQAAMEREMELQMAAETEALNAAHRAQVMTEVDKYRLLIENKIQRNWIEPENKGFCNFRMKLAPGGLVLSVTSVSGDQLHCETGQRAIYKAEPLPVSSDPDVFAELKDSYFQLKNAED
ncbi:MAG: cell envelope integrity protein TolA [Kangiellaceae bacterium]